MHLEDFRCIHRLRVRWAEIDQQKIVFNAHYLMYIDTAMSEYWRALALPYESSMQLLGGEMFLRKTTLEYHAPAQLDDTLSIGLRCERIGTTSATFTAGVLREGRLLASAEMVYVFADPATQTSQPVPPALRALFEGFEAGEAMVQIHLGDWPTLGAQASAVRQAVFVQEQGIAREDEWDAADAGALHALALNRLGQPVATGRLLPSTSGVARVGRMAVVRGLRGSGLGQQVLAALQHAAAERGERQILLSAQRSAESFYRRQGYVPRGAPYEEVGIAHIDMARAL